MDQASAGEESSQEEDEGEESDDALDIARKLRADYVGRGNVKKVRDARKRLGLYNSLAKCEPLLVEFKDWLLMGNCSAKDVENKINQIGKLLKYVIDNPSAARSSQQALDHVEGQIQTEALLDPPAIAKYYNTLSSAEVKMKASAVKNDVNAAKLFVKFAATSQERFGGGGLRLPRAAAQQQRGEGPLQRVRRTSRR